jgi:hypothetical protein
VSLSPEKSGLNILDETLLGRDAGLFGGSKPAAGFVAEDREPGGREMLGPFSFSILNLLRTRQFDDFGE